jgi:hypothetical protein
LFEITGRPNTVHVSNPKLEGTELEWANNFEKGDPRVLNHVASPLHYPHAFSDYRGHPTPHHGFNRGLGPVGGYGYPYQHG